MTAAIDGVRRDLGETRTALSDWWAAEHLSGESEQLQAAVESLLRAVSTLTNEVEDLRLHYSALRQRIDDRERGGPYAYLGGGRNSR